MMYKGKLYKSKLYKSTLHKSKLYKGKWKLLVLLLTGLFSAMVALPPGTAQQHATGENASSADPTAAELRACIPDWEGFFERTEIVTSISNSGRIYYYLHLFQPLTNYPDRAVVSFPDSGGQCRTEFLDAASTETSLGAELSTSLARQFSLKLYQLEIDKIGRDGLQQQINRLALEAAPNFRMAPEDIWALEQLGITVPTRLMEER